jgi:antitoxin VapB
MLATAKVFSTGSSQAVRLPKAFRLDTAEVWISKDEVTGEITLKPKNDDQRRRRLEALLRMIEENPLDDDFAFRDERAAVDYPRDPFSDDEPAGSPA